MSEDIGKLSTAKYGKSKVRVFRIVREEERRHYVVEYNVTVLLEGEIETRYVDAACVVDRRCSLMDNGVVIPTRIIVSLWLLIPVRFFSTVSLSVLISLFLVKNIIYCKPITIISQIKRDISSS